MTQDSFGILVDLGQSRLCKIENGGLRLRDVEEVARIAATLDVPSTLLGFGPDAGSLGGTHNGRAVSWLHRRDFIASVTALALAVDGTGELHERLVAFDSYAGPPGRVGLADIERIEATTAVFRDWDNRWGGGLYRMAVTGQLWSVLATARTASCGEEVRHFDEIELKALHGHVYHVLADHIPAAAATGADLLREATTHRGPEFARSATLNLIGLSATYFQQGTDLDEGVQVGLQALDRAGTLNSPRLLSRLHGLRRTAARYGHHPDVAELDERVRHILTDAA
jgi:hypothetical protein